MQTPHKSYNTGMVDVAGMVQTYFKKLGLAPEIAALYLALHVHGPQSISALSRTSGVERTRIYRMIDDLMASNLIEVTTQVKRGTIKAAPIANLRILISQREQELRSLQDELELIEQVVAPGGVSDAATRIQLFHGSDGASAMEANKAAYTGIVYLLSAKDMRLHKGNSSRTVPKHRCQILHTIAVYGDTVAHFTTKGGLFYGYEVHNEEAAALQRQLLDVLWDSLSP